MPFEPEPLRILPDHEALIAAIEQQQTWATDPVLRGRIRSEFICDLIRNMAGAGIVVYNAKVEEAIWAGIGDRLPRSTIEQRSAVRWLVYAAQHYVDHDKLVAQGYEPFTQDLIHRAFIADRPIEFPGGALAIVKRIKGVGIRAVKPRTRAALYLPDGLRPARIQEAAQDVP